MFIVVGLGNPGREYARTRHNVGFDVIDVLSEKHHIQLTKNAMHGQIGEGFVGGEKLVLVKPQTFMNLSGQCVTELVSWYKPEMDHLLLVYDDIDLPLGKLRMREKGSAGTHNGMRSVIGLLGRQDFPRLRVGVGKKARGMGAGRLGAQPLPDRGGSQDAVRCVSARGGRGGRPDEERAGKRHADGERAGVTYLREAMREAREPRVPAGV